MREVEDSFSDEGQRHTKEVKKNALKKETLALSQKANSKKK